MITPKRTTSSALSLTLFKSEAHRQYCLANDRRIRGRYLAVVETSIGILGGEALRARARDELGYPIKPDEMYPVADWVRLVIVAAEGGVSPRRLGTLFFPKFKQAHPEFFPQHPLTFREAMALIERAAREETDYGGAPYRMDLRSPDHLRIVRENNPLPCEFFAGILAGTLETLGYKGNVNEVSCRWTHGVACEFDAVLTSPMRL